MVSTAGASNGVQASYECTQGRTNHFCPAHALVGPGALNQPSSIVSLHAPIQSEDGAVVVNDLYLDAGSKHAHHSRAVLVGSCVGPCGFLCTGMLNWQYARARRLDQPLLGGLVVIAKFQ